MGRPVRAVWRVGLLACVAGLLACSGGDAPTATVAPTQMTAASAAASALPTETPSRAAQSALPSAAAAATPVAASPRAAVSPTAVAGGATATRPNCPLTRSVNITAVSPVGSPPVRSSVGQGHVLSGTVRSSRDCTPLAGATLVFWLAGPDGKYAPAYEATVIADRNGAYRFESTYPGTYEGTTPHIHMFIIADGHQGIEANYLPPANQTVGTFDIVLPVK